MKVIGVDNFARDNVDDVLIESNLTPEAAEAKADELNEKYSGPDAPRFYRAVADDHVLKVWEP